MDDRVHRGYEDGMSIPLAVPEVLIPPCNKPLQIFLSLLVLFLLHFNGVDEPAHDAMNPGKV